MPGGILINETVPTGLMTEESPAGGGAVWGCLNSRTWMEGTETFLRPWASGNPNYLAKMFDGPDAQGPVMHRSWDPGDPSYAAWKINLCNHPCFVFIQELYELDGVPFDASMVRTYTRRFRVVTRYPMMGVSSVATCPGIPMPYSAYVPGRAQEFDLLARAVRISGKREDTKEHTSWIIQVDYSTQMPDGGPVPTSAVQLGWSTIGIQNNPQDEPPHLEWDPETQTRTPLRDLDGKPFLNSAKQLIYPAPSVEDGVAVLVVTRNRVFASLEACRAHIEKFSYVVNSTTFLGALRGQALCLPPKAVEVYRGPFRFWRFTYRIKFKKRDTVSLTWFQDKFPNDTWQPKMLDAGMYEIRQGWFGPDPAGTLVPIFRGGQPVNYPVPLKDGTEAVAGDEQWLKFKYYPEVDFGDVILPVDKL